MKKFASAADASTKILESIVTAVVMLAIGGVMVHQWWDWEGRDPVFYAPASKMHITPGKAGDIVTVFMPLLPLRNCTVDKERSTRHVVQGETGIVDVLASDPPSIGLTKIWNLDYQFSTVVPEWLEPGEALISWDILWDCGVREITVSTPQMRLQIDP